MTFDELYQEAKALLDSLTDQWKTIEIIEDRGSGVSQTMEVLAENGLVWLEYTHVFRSIRDPNNDFLRTYSCTGMSQLVGPLLSQSWYEECAGYPALEKKVREEIIGDAELTKIRCKCSETGIIFKTRLKQNLDPFEGIPSHVGARVSRFDIRPFRQSDSPPRLISAASGEGNTPTNLEAEQATIEGIKSDTSKQLAVDIGNEFGKHLGRFFTPKGETTEQKWDRLSREQFNGTGWSKLADLYFVEKGETPTAADRRLKQDEIRKAVERLRANK